MERESSPVFWSLARQRGRCTSMRYKFILSWKPWIIGYFRLRKQTYSCKVWSPNNNEWHVFPVLVSQPLSEWKHWFCRELLRRLKVILVLKCRPVRGEEIQGSDADMFEVGREASCLSITLSLQHCPWSLKLCGGVGVGRGVKTCFLGPAIKLTIRGTGIP